MFVFVAPDDTRHDSRQCELAVPLVAFGFALLFPRLFDAPTSHRQPLFAITAPFTIAKQQKVKDCMVCTSRHQEPENVVLGLISTIFLFNFSQYHCHS